MTPSAQENFINLPEIYERIDREVDVIMQLLDNLVSTEEGALTEDIGKMKESCRHFKAEVARFMAEKKTTGRVVEDKQEYFSKIRHDLFNCVSAVQGYSELILEDLQNTRSPLFEKFEKIAVVITQILKMIDSIRTSRSSPISTQKSSPIAPVVFETEVKSAAQADADFRHFKEKFSILIVDDNEENCLLLERYLHRLGFSNIQIAHDGYQSLALKDRADLMLLDVDMPGMSGIDVLSNIKEDILQGRIMVLMVSASDTLENTIECIKFGAEDFLTKPFNPNLLQVRINACVEKKWTIVQQRIFREKMKFERQRYEKLLNAVFPSMIVEELTKTGKVQAAFYPNVAILFADIVGFTSYCDAHEPGEIITHLQEIAGLSETLAIKHNIQKIKTIGDCFLGVSGMLTKSDNPVLDCVNFGKELLQSLDKLPSKWKLRIGVNFGTVIGGIVGHKQYLFDIWGDAVNTASRVQSLAEPNSIYLSKTAWDQVSSLCHGESIGLQKVKGKEPFEVFVIN